MYTIKFNAIDIEAKVVYCYFRDISENKKNSGIERQFSYDTFVEKEPVLKSMLEGDIYSIYLEDSYTEKKSVDGSYTSLTDYETEYVKDLVKRACVDLDFDNLLVSTIDDQINNFIKEFFEETNTSSTTTPLIDTQRDFLEEFFKDIEDTHNTEEIDNLEEVFNKTEEKDIK
jgi:hypothetical protein